MNDIKENVLLRAKASGFDIVEYLGEYKGYQIWNPEFTDGLNHCIGVGYYIVDKNGSIIYEGNTDFADEITYEFFIKHRNEINESGMKEIVLIKAKELGYQNVVYISQYKELEIWLPYRTDGKPYILGSELLAVNKNNDIMPYKNSDMHEHFCQFQWYKNLLNEIRKKYPNA